MVVLEELACTVKDKESWMKIDADENEKMIPVQIP